MSIWFRRSPAPAATRSEWPTIPWSQVAASYSRSYADVDLSAAATSMQSVAVRSAVDLIASLASELPAGVFSGSGATRRERTMPGYLEDPGGDGTGLADWSYRVVESWLLRGNLYGDILDVAPTGFPTQVELFYPDDVHGWLDSEGVTRWSVNGKPVTDLSRFLHRRVNPVPGRILGLSPIAFHAEQIGLSLTATRFGRQWFADGAHPGGILSNSEEDMSDPVKAKTAKERFMAALRGTREPVVLGKGWKWDKVQIAPNESQFLETQGFSEAQCARIFGPGIAEVLGYESGGSLTYSNVESRSAHLLVYAVNRWLRRLERLLTSMLPRPQYVRIDRDALLQSTTLERYRAHESALKNRWKTVNEIRDDEDMPAVGWGDEPNLTYIGESTTVQEEPTGAEAPPKKDGT